MNSFLRWSRFNVVGAMGMLVQLAALAFFNGSAAGHYLVASSAALELTLVHNFVWHLNYTWPDRRGHDPWPSRFIRFHLSNGLVSMLGNLALMRILVHEARLPVIASNGITILCCSLVNFCIGDRWAFTVKPLATVSGNFARECAAIKAGPWTMPHCFSSGLCGEVNFMRLKSTPKCGASRVPSI